MAVQRTSDPLNIAAGRTSQIQQSQQRAASPDINSALEGGVRPVYEGPRPGDSQVLDALLGAANKAAWRGVELAQEDAYLRGAAQVGRINSEEQLTSDPLTRAWEVAGYRDTMGRLSLADRAAQMSADMVTLRQQSPQKMEEYLNRTRREVETSLQGMSREARNASVGQLLLQDRAALKEHRVEHAKFIIDQRTSSLQGAAGVLIADLGRNRGDLDAYSANVDKTMLWLQGNIVSDPALPIEVKQKLVSQVASYALSENHQMLYDQMRNNDQGVLPNGKRGNLLSFLPLEAQEKLGEDFRKSLKETEAMRNGQYLNNLAALRASFSSPTGFPTVGVVNEALQEGLRNGSVNATNYESIWKDYYSAAAKYGNKAAAAEAYLQGNGQALNDLGATSEEGLAAAQETFQRNKVPLATQMSSLMSAGMSGSANAFSEVGKMLRAPVAELMSGKPLTEASSSMLGSFLQQIDTAEANGQAGAFYLAQSGLNEDQRVVVSWIRDYVRNDGRTVEDAASLAAARVADDAKLPPDARRNAMADPQRLKEDREIVSSIGDRGVLGSIWSHLKFWDAKDQGNLREVQPYNPILFGNEVASDMASAQAQLRLSEELAWVGERNPSADAGTRRSTALANVAAATIPTENGPMFLPRGTNLQSVFGVDQTVGRERVGLALDEYTKSIRGDAAAVSYRVTPAGTIRYDMYQENGAFMGGAEIPASEIGRIVGQQREREASRGAQLYGPGVLIKQGENSVRFNGANTAAVAPQTMLEFRRGLVDSEGVRMTPYDDLSGRGIRTGGVGVSSTNTYFPHELKDKPWPEDVVNYTFSQASNEAANAGMQEQRKLGLGGDSAFLLLGELAYQSGPGFANTKGYRPLMQALEARDPDAALTALRDTPAYKWAQPARREKYEKNLTNIFKE